jgi:hypothetical protein
MTFKRKPDLFDAADARARSSDPETSHEAAAHMDATGTTSRLENEVYSFMKMHHGRWTTPEIAGALNRHAWSISPRMVPLEEKKLIRRDGKKRVINSTGRPRELQAWVVNTGEPEDTSQPEDGGHTGLPIAAVKAQWEREANERAQMNVQRAIDIDNATHGEPEDGEGA